MKSAPACAPPRLTASGPCRRATISLTPLIDVVFILLVFFMLASSFLDWRAIELSAPRGAAAGDPLVGVMLVEVRSDSIRLGGVPVTPAELVQRVDARVRRRPDTPVRVRPAAGVTLQTAVDVLDRVSAAGAKDLALIRGARR